MDRRSLSNFLTIQETEALKELKSTLKEFLDNKIVKFVLYRSKARGDYDPESDIDIATIVKGMTRLKNQLLDKAAEIEFKHCIALSNFQN